MISIHIQIRHCNDQKMEILLNQTIELFLTIDREITTAQEYFIIGYIPVDR
jgi:hypothetical protein